MEKRVEVLLFLEAHCPYCNYVHKYILRDLQVRRDEWSRKLGFMLPMIDIRLIDVNSNYQTRYSKWYEWYSRKIGGRYTPIIVIADKIFYLWGSEKTEKLEKGQLSRTVLLKSQIIEAIRDMAIYKEPNYFQAKPLFFTTNPRREKAPVPAYWR